MDNNLVELGKKSKKASKKIKKEAKQARRRDKEYMKALEQLADRAESLMTIAPGSGLFAKAFAKDFERLNADVTKVMDIKNRYAIKHPAA